MQVDYVRQLATYLVAGSVYLLGIAAGSVIVVGRNVNRLFSRR